MPASSVDLPELELTRRALSEANGVELALVFGSVARGTAASDSDIDVAVLGAELDVLELSSLIAGAVGRDAQVVRLEAASIPLLEAVIEDGIVVHEGTPGASGAWRSRTLTALALDRPWYALQRDAWLARVAKEGI